MEKSLTIYFFFLEKTCHRSEHIFTSHGMCIISSIYLVRNSCDFLKKFRKFVYTKHWLLFLCVYTFLVNLIAYSTRLIIYHQIKEHNMFVAALILHLNWCYKSQAHLWHFFRNQLPEKQKEISSILMLIALQSTLYREENSSNRRRHIMAMRMVFKIATRLVARFTVRWQMLKYLATCMWRQPKSVGRVLWIQNECVLTVKWRELHF